MSFGIIGPVSCQPISRAVPVLVPRAGPAAQALYRPCLVPALALWCRARAVLGPCFFGSCPCWPIGSGPFGHLYCPRRRGCPPGLPPLLSAQFEFRAVRAASSVGRGASSSPPPDRLGSVDKTSDRRYHIKAQM